MEMHARRADGQDPANGGSNPEITGGSPSHADAAHEENHQ